AVHPHRRGQVLLGLLARARAPVELAEAEVAVGLQRAHGELFGLAEGLTVVRFGLLALARTAPRCNITEEMHGMRVVAPFSVPMGKRQCPLGERARLVQVARQ